MEAGEAAAQPPPPPQQEEQQQEDDKTMMDEDATQDPNESSEYINKKCFCKVYYLLLYYGNLYKRL